MEFVVYGACKGKGRPRFRRAGNFVQTYSPKETLNYEQLVRNEFISACKENNINLELGQPFTVATRITIKAVYSIPTSFSKKKQALAVDGDIRPLTKPDVDNVAKIILDALNKIAFKDDSYVTTLTVKKRYGLVPCVIVEINSDK